MRNENNSFYDSGVSPDALKSDNEKKRSSGKVVIAIVVVTRYFGGTQLGTGGLARAYGEVAAEAVREAVPCVFAAAARYEIRVEFPLFERLKYVLEKEGFPVDRVMYRDCPVIQILCPKNSEDRLAQICSDHTSGRSTPVFVEDAEMIVERVGETRNE